MPDLSVRDAMSNSAQRINFRVFFFFLPVLGERKLPGVWNGGRDVRMQSFINRLTINDTNLALPLPEVSGATIS